MLLSLPCCIRKTVKAHALANRRGSDRIGLRCWRHGRHSRAFTRDILRRWQRTAPNPRYYETLRLPMAPLGVLRCSLSFPNTLWRSSGFVSRVLSHTARVRGTSLLPAWDCSQFQGFGLTLARRKGRLYYLYPHAATTPNAHPATPPTSHALRIQAWYVACPTDTLHAQVRWWHPDNDCFPVSRACGRHSTKQRGHSVE